MPSSGISRASRQVICVADSVPSVVSDTVKSSITSASGSEFKITVKLPVSPASDVVVSTIVSVMPAVSSSTFTKDTSAGSIAA